MRYAVTILLFIRLCGSAWAAELVVGDPNDPTTIESIQALKNGVPVGPTFVPTLLVERTPVRSPGCATPPVRVYAVPVTPGGLVDQWKVRVKGVNGTVTDSCNAVTLAIPTSTPTVAPPSTATRTPTLKPPHAVEIQ